MPHLRFGWTLTELLLALCVLAVLGSLAAPSWRLAIERVRLVTQSNALLAGLHQARTQALLRNEPWALCLSADGRRCVESRAGTAQAWLIVPARLNALGPSVDRLSPGLVTAVGARLPPSLRVHGTRTRIVFWPVSRSGTTATLT
ncbi:MAG: GspH/FimT family pseudopilin, partial [Steroidobacteraceae bacterium]|nr:GspH/FimT family pseudopilin [Steroidobacteraceae bacterium]MDW8259494.1 GspH/FimT family pseudopilin [Gammaproteobacteria bacterium]